MDDSYQLIWYPFLHRSFARLNCRLAGIRNMINAKMSVFQPRPSAVGSTEHDVDERGSLSTVGNSSIPIHSIGLRADRISHMVTIAEE